MYFLNWPVLLDIAAILAMGLLGVFGLVAYAMRSSVRSRALPRGTSRLTQADLQEAHDRACIEEMAQKSMRMAGGAR